jgi:hypothetical protein
VDLSLKGWIVKVTGVLVVLPALLNAGYDVYAAAAKLPRTDAEKTNSELFRKYFNTSPLATMPVQIQSNSGTVDARLAVYGEGDIYVEYGKASQWFKLPKIESSSAKVSLSLIASAYAQTPPVGAVSSQASVVSQHEAIDGNILTRSRIYADGVTEQRRIDIRSGKTVSVDFGKVEKAGVPSATPAPHTFKVQTVDVRQLRAGG